MCLRFFKRSFISWITGQNVRKVLIFAVFALYIARILKIFSMLFLDMPRNNFYQPQGWPGFCIGGLLKNSNRNAYPNSNLDSYPSIPLQVSLPELFLLSFKNRTSVAGLSVIICKSAMQKTYCFRQAVP